MAPALRTLDHVGSGCRRRMMLGSGLTDLTWMVSVEQRQNGSWFGTALCLVFVASALVACNDDGGDPPPPAAGTGSAAVSGTAAPAAGTGAAGTGTAGSGTAGTGTAGTGIAGAGAAGTGTAGTGTAGTGTAGTGSAMPGLTCADADTTTPAAMLHANAAAAMFPPMPGMNGGCAFSSCHNMSAKKANLVLDGSMTDLNALLVGKPSCEAPSLSLIDGSGGDAALAKSWLWQKLAAPIDASGNLTANPEWGMAGNCGQSSGAGYGVRMPLGQTELLSAPKLNAIKSWICSGAKGP